jgi:hypothetical protein
MINVYWTTTRYKESKIILFLISVPSYQFVIKSIGYLPGNKRRGSLRSKFLHPRFVELEIGIKLDGLPYFEITEKELMGWIGRVSLDQVASLDDIGWIMKVKKDYESVLDENKD